MADPSGSRVVLTAPASEMSEYNNSPFHAFVGGFAKSIFPLWLLRKKVYPPVERDLDFKAKFAPYGLRKVEALLLENGFDKSEIAVVHPADLDKFVGPNTRAVGISSMDPTGMGYVSTTYSSLVGGGEPINAIEFKALLNHRSLQVFKPKLIVGGFGSWQLERKKTSASHGVDCVIIGGKPKPIIEVFKRATNGDPIPNVVSADKYLEDENIPTIKHAAIHGVVEISKGCGRNCQFCTTTMQKKEDVPLKDIMREVEINVRDGGSNITLVTEDLFLYGSKDSRFRPNKSAMLNLLKNVAAYSGVRRIQPSHMSLAPIVSDPLMVRDAAEILINHHWYSHDGKPIVTSETGIETGSVRLMQKYMPGKTLPFEPKQWKEIVTQAFGILNDNNWYPLATLIVGLPGENEEDVADTLELMDELKDFNAFYVPLFFVPLENCLLMHKPGTEVASLNQIRWEFLARCWEYNVKIWKDTFLGDKIPNPFLSKVAKHTAIPFAAKIAQAYYRFKGFEAMGNAIWAMSKMVDS